MKKRRSLTIIALLIALVVSVGMFIGYGCSCGGDTGGSNYYKVTFMVEGKQYGEIKEVLKNRRVSKPDDPTFENESYIFTGWYTSATFESDTLWNFDTDIVTSDMTLYAGYREVFGYVTHLGIADEACTSKLVWSQKAVSDAADYEVTITNVRNESQTLEGTVTFDSENYLVTFTPSQIPQGGLYSASVKDTNFTEAAATAEELLFCGEGTESNPYLIGSAKDFTKVNQTNVEEGTHFRLFRNITIETSREEQSDFVFNGTLMGYGKTITLENSNCAAIYKVGEQGYVYNVNVAGNVSSGSYDSIGTIADFNEGKIEKITVTANVTSTGGLVGSSGLNNALDTSLADGQGSRGIAGGVVGTNEKKGTVLNCKIVTSKSSTGTVKARIGGGTIVGLNYGRIESCVSNGCFGAWNSTESGGKSLSTYSYSGGIAGINAGTITKCSVSGSGKVLAQRYTDASQVVAGTNNSDLGGVVGYNMKDGVVSECSFSGIRVHGDENIGGIAGENAGTVSDCYAEGIYNSTTKVLSYVGGRINVGGIVGKDSSGNVERCFSTVNVYSFTENTGYSIAENANNSVYVSANPNANSQVSGEKPNPQYAALKVPTGNGNVAVEITAHSYDDETVLGSDFKLSADYLGTINGANKFEYNEDEETIKLSYEKDVPPEETIRTNLYYGVSLWKTVEIPETPETVSGPLKYGHVLAGWALSAGGEIKFAADTKISLYDLIDYADKDGEASLYAIYTERENVEGLVVAVWNYGDVTQEQADQMKADYLAQAGELTYDVVFRLYTEEKIADFGAHVVSDGDVDVALNGGATMNASNNFDYLARANMTYSGFESRRAALMNDSEEAVAFYSFITSIESEWAEVTLSVDGTEYKDNLNSIINNEMEIPAVEVPEGKVFAGWSTSENGAVAVAAGSLTYAAVASVVSDGKVTLYPVVKDVPNPDAQKVVVAIWTNWVSAEQKQSIINDFTAYLESQGINLSDYDIEYRDYTDTKVADLGAAVNGDGDVDIIVGCGNNVNSSSGADIEIIEKADMTYSGLTSRMTARLTDSEIAVMLYAFLTAQA